MWLAPQWGFRSVIHCQDRPGTQLLELWRPPEPSLHYCNRCTLDSSISAQLVTASSKLLNTEATNASNQNVRPIRAKIGISWAVLDFPRSPLGRKVLQSAGVGRVARFVVSFVIAPATSTGLSPNVVWANPPRGSSLHVWATSPDVLN